MIARQWKGATRASDADAYVDYLGRTGFSEYERVAGHRRTIALRRIHGDRAEFVILSLWDSMDAIRRFAGDDVDRAVFYPEDDRYLVERDEQVTHFDVVYQYPEQQ
jgi:heme-degrading monooxygenase HmoA